MSFSVSFPEGSHVQDCRKKTVELPCTLEFSSAKPVSMTDYIVFSDKTTGKRYRFSNQYMTKLKCLIRLINILIKSQDY